MWIVLIVATCLAAQEVALERVLENSWEASPELGAAGILQMLEAGRVTDGEARKALLAEALGLAKKAPEAIAYTYRMGPTDAIGFQHSRAFRKGIDRVSLLSRYVVLARAARVSEWREALAAARASVPEEKLPECFDPMVVDYSWINRALATEEALREQFPFSLRMGLKFCRPHEMYWIDDIGAGLHSRLEDPGLLSDLRRWHVRDAQEMSLWFHEKAALLMALRFGKQTQQLEAYAELLAHLTGDLAKQVKQRRRLDWFSEVVHLVDRLARSGQQQEVVKLQEHPDPDIALAAMLWGARVDGKAKAKLR